MGIYKIEREPDRVAGAEQNVWHVRHYVADDPNPTVSSRKPTNLPKAWQDALGSAAKMAIMQSRHVDYIDVEVEDGRIYRVRVERIK